MKARRSAFPMWWCRDRSRKCRSPSPKRPRRAIPVPTRFRAMRRSKADRRATATATSWFSIATAGRSTNCSTPSPTARAAGRPAAARNGIWSRTRSGPTGWTSADAAGLPILPGLVRYDEVVGRKSLDHAMRFTLAKTRRAYVPPASHWASDAHDDNLPPMGMRVRLKADYDLTGFSPEARVILQALKKYGMILADNGTDNFISGAPDPRWNMDALRQLRRVHDQGPRSGRDEGHGGRPATAITASWRPAASPRYKTACPTGFPSSIPTTRSTSMRAIARCMPSSPATACSPM